MPNVPLHIIQRGNNRQACFYVDEDYRLYLDWLREHADKTGCRVHAYVLMTNHVHLLISAERPEAPGALMKALGQRYIELNTVRADMVAHPAEYRWSSYRANAQGETDALLKQYPHYDALGTDAASRQAAYRELFRYELEPGLVAEIRRATNVNYALGNEGFAAQVTAALGRRAAPVKSGRPRRMQKSESGGIV